MAHRVTLKPTGHSYEVPEGKNVLQAGLDAGYMLPYSCRAGVCRTCRGTIVEGEVDYGAVHATYLPESDKAKGYALLCQAKPLTDLTIEVREVHGVRPRIIPCRVERFDKPAADVAVLGLRLPMNENFRFLSGQYIAILLKVVTPTTYSLPTTRHPSRGPMRSVHSPVMQDFPDMSVMQVYACGAPIVVESARKDFSLSCKLSAEEFYADSFLTEADKAAA